MCKFAQKLAGRSNKGTEVRCYIKISVPGIKEPVLGWTELHKKIFFVFMILLLEQLSKILKVADPRSSTPRIEPTLGFSSFSMLLHFWSDGFGSKYCDRLAALAVENNCEWS